MNGRALGSRSLAILAAGVFLGLALSRRLNFDESLALRAGWLDVEGIRASPAFLMPWTLFAGLVGHLFGDPGTVLVLLRLAVATLVAGAFALATRAAALASSGVATAAWLALGSAAFVAHGLEFRYDAAILVLLLFAFTLIATRKDSAYVGAVVAMISLHHLKGAYFGVGVALICVTFSSDRRRDARRFGLAAVAVWVGWLACIAALGLTDRFRESLVTFFDLAGGTTRTALGETIGPTLLRDLAWWSFILTAVGVGVWNRHHRDGVRTLSLAYAFSGLGIAFWLVHPHAWAYLAALPTPFLAIAAAREMTGSRKVLGVALATGCIGLLLQVASSTPLQGSHLIAASRAPMAPEVELLRAAKLALTPQDGVLDPSGLIYFGAPCLREWYIDTLFMEKLEKGTWMQELAGGIPARCTMVLNTYRLGALPLEARRSLGADFRLLRCGVAVRPDHANVESLAKVSGVGHVESYW